ncbi:MAG TPA: thiamine-phosphate kinase [Rhodospirillaceae bacterium]|nr:thiamine-phosphate kinase [Rhodospirillaceae bacterium]HAT34283.1 thiamine-phosphate kinase [Rhodospirillaceae bacterium]
MTGKGEFGRIRDFLSPLAGEGAFDLTDDAALIAEAPGQELVVTTDTIIAGVHFMGDEDPSLIAAKLLRVSLSDLAAMGATPAGYTLNWALPVTCDDVWIESFCRGLGEQQTMFGLSLLGGDSVSGPGPVCLTATLFGRVPVGQALRRKGAAAGDSIYVSGTIGDGALGLLAAKGDLAGLDAVSMNALISRYRLPEPRLEVGQALRGKASAAADVSDGLLADLGHIAAASGLGAEIEFAKIPLSAAAGAALESNEDLWRSVVTGGDDYELVFTGPLGLDVSLESVDINVTAIGRMTRDSGVSLLDVDGKSLHLEQTGYRHG